MRSWSLRYVMGNIARFSDGRLALLYGAEARQTLLRGEMPNEITIAGHVPHPQTVAVMESRGQSAGETCIDLGGRVRLSSICASRIPRQSLLFFRPANSVRMEEGWRGDNTGA